MKKLLISLLFFPGIALGMKRSISHEEDQSKRIQIGENAENEPPIESPLQMGLRSALDTFARVQHETASPALEEQCAAMTDLLRSFAQTKGLTDLASYEPVISGATPTNPTQTLGVAIGIVDIYLRTICNYQPETTIPALRKIARVADISLDGFPEESRHIRLTPPSSLDGSDTDENIARIIEGDREFTLASPLADEFDWPNPTEFAQLPVHGASEGSDGEESYQ